MKALVIVAPAEKEFITKKVIADTLCLEDHYRLGGMKRIVPFNALVVTSTIKADSMNFLNTSTINTAKGPLRS